MDFKGFLEIVSSVPLRADKMIFMLVAL